MADRKPPRSTGDEREVLLTLLQYQRESLVRKVEGVSDADARSSPVGSGTSLLWLVKHLARAERNWVLAWFAGTHELSDDKLPPADADTLTSCVADYRAMWPVVDAVIRDARLDDTIQRPGEDPVSLRWIVGHLLEETARHAGHADILRELLDGHTGR